MKMLFVFSILCLFSVHEVISQKSNVQYAIPKLILTECIKDFDIIGDLTDRVSTKDRPKTSNIDATCLYACGLRKWSEERGLTLYKGLLEMIDEVYKSGFNVTKFTRADITSKVERCLVKENDCELARCVGIFASPFIDVYLYYMKKN